MNRLRENIHMVSLTAFIRVIGWFCGALFITALMFDLASYAAHSIVEKL